MQGTFRGVSRACWSEGFPKQESTSSRQLVSHWFFVKKIYLHSKRLLGCLGVVAAGRKPFHVHTGRVAKNLPKMIGKMALITEASAHSRLPNRSGLGQQRPRVIQPKASLVCVRRKSDFFPKYSNQVEGAQVCDACEFIQTQIFRIATFEAFLHPFNCPMFISNF